MVSLPQAYPRPERNHGVHSRAAALLRATAPGPVGGLRVLDAARMRVACDTCRCHAGETAPAATKRIGGRPGSPPRPRSPR